MPNLTCCPKILAAGDADSLRLVHWASFPDMIDRLEAAGKHVIIVDPGPEIQHHIRKYVLRHTTRAGRLVTIARAGHDAVAYSVSVRLNEIGSDRPSSGAVLCDELFCYGGDVDGAFYSDNYHLSLTGARNLVDALFLPGGVWTFP